MSSDNTEYPPSPTNPYPDEPPLRVVPKATLNSLMLDKMDDTSLEAAHLENRIASLSAGLVEVYATSTLLLKVLVAALLLNTLLLIGLLVAVSFLYGAMR